MKRTAAGLMFALVVATTSMLALAKDKQVVIQPVVEKEAEPAVEKVLTPAELLKAAKIDNSPANLKDYIRQRIATPAQREALKNLLLRLGSDDFDTREKASDELIGAGLYAIPVLKNVDKAGDPEVVRRVEFCLAKIDPDTEYSRLLAVVSELVRQKVPGTFDILLEYLPTAIDDDGIQEAIREGLTRLTRDTKRVDPVLETNLKSPDAALRLLSIRIVADALPDSKAILETASKDTDPGVRYWSATTLVRQGRKDIVPVLFGLLEAGPIELAYLTEDLFVRMLGDGEPPTVISTNTPEARKAVREKWEKWWQANRDKVDLAKIDEAEPLRGLTIILEVDQVAVNGGQGRVWECGRDGKQRWEIGNVNGPVDVQVLPGNRLLIAEYYVSKVTERDRTGKILWESPKMSSSVVSAHRTTTNTTLIATMSSVDEIDAKGKILHTFPAQQGTVYHVRRARNGHTFILAGGGLTEYNVDRKQVRKIAVPASSWGGFELLPNGNFLVAGYTLGTYAEYTADGKVVFSHATGLAPTRVQRLRDGSTLVAGGNMMQVVEYSRDKKEVWKVQTKGRPFSAIRY